MDGWKLLILLLALTTVARSLTTNNTSSDNVEVFKVDTKGKNITSIINEGSRLKTVVNDTSQQISLDKDNKVETNRANETVSQIYRVIREANLKTETNVDLESESPEVVVETNKGPVKGYEMPETTGVIQFLDIPYGIYERNFEKPTQAKQWSETREITEHTIVCPQMDSDNKYKGQRDCLTLSVFAPYNVTGASVLVHIHDGDFLNANNEIRHSPENIVSRGIILVVPNYRIGAYGFLCLQNETAQGNAGLKDLTMALEWTAQNIEQFGGSPDDVTVSGVDKAGALVGHLMLSPKSRHLFTKAITESGSVLSHWALDRNPLDNALVLAETLRKDHNIVQSNIFGENITEMNLVLASKDVTFRPCIEANSDDAFISESPWSILQKHKTNISLMAGTANHAGLQEALLANLTLINEHFEIILPQDLHFNKGEQRIEYANRLRAVYFGSDEITEKTDIENISLCYTDSLYLGPDIRTARYFLSTGAKVYFFEFSFADPNQENTSVRGAQRGDVIKLVFAKKQAPDTPLRLEIDATQFMIEVLTDLWASFIQEGTPTSQNMTWSPLSQVNETDEAWLSIDKDVSLLKGIHVDRLALWTEIYEEHYLDNNSSGQINPWRYILYMSIALGMKLTMIF